jgi:hypothetical protein
MARRAAAGLDYPNPILLVADVLADAGTAGELTLFRHFEKR